MVPRSAGGVYLCESGLWLCACLLYVVPAGARAVHVDNVRYSESIGVRSLGEARASLRPRGDVPRITLTPHILIQRPERAERTRVQGAGALGW